ncbi:MAG: hypothetical protein ABI847_16730, partial [Anaerolineales bacterium]
YGFGGSQNTYDLSMTGGCYAQAVSDFASADASAVRLAVAEASPSTTVKLAGYCPGTAFEDNGNQMLQIDKFLVLAGGYSPSNWTTADLVGQPTTLDAMNGGRVISATGKLDLMGFTVQHGFGDFGGGLSLQGTTVMTSMMFYRNTVDYSGGGAYVSDRAFISNTNFIENVAVDSGGGLWADATQIFGGQVQGNRAGLDGAGIYADVSLVLFGATLDSNVAQANGGGAHAGSDFNYVEAEFFSNEAGQGGGLYSSGSVTVIDSAFLGNSATQAGDGAAAVGFMTVNNGTFTANNSVYGGALFAYDTLNMENSLLTFNSATNGGAVLGQSGLIVNRTTFADNTATAGGGALGQASFLTAQQNAPAGGTTPYAKLFNNLFARNSAASGLDLAFGLPANNVLEHNTFYANGHPAPASIVVLDGSLAAHNSLFSGYAKALQRAGSASVSEDYNLYFGGGGAVSSYFSGTVTSGGHSLVADPLLADPLLADAPNGDFRLTYASPARDRGLNQLIPVDHDGDPRPYGVGVDIGYDELTGYPLLYLPLVLRLAP